MQMHPKSCPFWHPFITLALCLALPTLSYAIDPKFELDPSALGKRFPIPPPPSEARKETGGSAKAEKKDAEKPGKKESAGQGAKGAAAREKVSSYTVKPGDHLYKVLSREYGVRGARADVLVQRVLRLNGIKDIHGLKTGSTLLIPLAPGAAAKESKTHAQSAKHTRKSEKEAPQAPAAEHQIVLAKLAPQDDDATVEAARQVWPRLVPPVAGRGSDHFDYRSSAFSLALDPARYPTLPAQDGGTILVDGAGTLPALVRSLIQEKNPQVRIVSEDATNRRRFYRALLSAAQFYSFEEDFSVDFGSDPKITVQTDFKIEKSPDSLLRQDITLLNVSETRRATPEGLVKLLAGNGFRLVEAGAPVYQTPGGAADLLYQVSEKEPKKILDSFLVALAVPFETGKNIDLYAKENIGIRLDVPVDRYFEDNGQRYAVALFNGDPVTYTLIRLLETKGYRVIMLQEGDDFRSITDKVLSRLRIPGRYGDYDLWSAAKVGYGVRMSGAMIRDNRNGDRNLFVTDRQLDPLVKELADLNGYHLLSGR
jgi:hypothetical protein